MIIRLARPFVSSVHRSQFTVHRSQITDHRSPFTGHWALVTGHWLLCGGGVAEAVGLVGTGVGGVAAAIVGGVGGDVGLGAAEDFFEVLQPLGYVGGEAPGLLGDVVAAEAVVAVGAEEVEAFDAQGLGEEAFVGYAGEGVGDDVVLYGDVVEEGVGDVVGAFDFEDGEGAVEVFAHHVGEDEDVVVDESCLEDLDGAFLLEEAGGEGGVAADVHAEVEVEVDGVGEGVFEGAFEGAAMAEALEGLGRIVCELGVVDVEVHGALALE